MLLLLHFSRPHCLSVKHTAISYLCNASIQKSLASILLKCARWSAYFIYQSARVSPPRTPLNKWAGLGAGLELSVHPHMLRHGKGYQLAYEGIDTRAIQS
ncbi:MAG: tyrosine-type recombinase/integrase [Candidatus Obscuribacterales bacterium]|nr:tyrosine-type recombinase/integrase [Candidatus Obscuribacterales bacterium]